MTTALDPVFRSLAQNMLATFGMSANLYRPDTSATNDSTDAEVVPTVFGPYAVKVSPPSQYKIGRGDGERGSSSSQSKLQCLVAATDVSLPSGYPPDRGWELRIGSRIFFIDEVQPIYSGDQVAAYKMIFIGSGAP